MTRAVDYARARKGPVLVHAHVIRPYSHSLSDDEVHYRSAAEREADVAKDPISRFPRYLLAEGLATEGELEAIRQRADEEVSVAAETAFLVAFGWIEPDPPHLASKRNRNRRHRILPR